MTTIEGDLEILVKRVEAITKVLANLTEKVTGICVAMEEILSSGEELIASQETSAKPEPESPLKEGTSRDWN